jgi:hypothetical protein
MQKKSTWEEAVELAFSSAREKLGTLILEEVAKKSGTFFHRGGNGGYLELIFVGRKYRVMFPEGNVRDEGGGELHLIRTVLILHYLIEAQGKDLDGRWVDFRSLPGGMAYSPVFRGRVISRLLRLFGQRPQELITAASPLGGRAIEMADVAVVIPAFPRVPVVLALWRGDNEFRPEGTILYDASIPAYLKTEDAIIVCEEILSELKKNV